MVYVSETLAEMIGPTPRFPLLNGISYIVAGDNKYQASGYNWYDADYSKNGVTYNKRLCFFNDRFNIHLEDTIRVLTYMKL
jgi:hypothetical protein